METDPASGKGNNVLDLGHGCPTKPISDFSMP